MHHPASFVLGALISLFVPFGGSWAQEADRELLTVAERSGFRATSRHAEVLEFIGRLQERAGHVRRLDFGQSVEGRPMAAVVVVQEENLARTSLMKNMKSTKNMNAKEKLQKGPNPPLLQTGLPREWKEMYEQLPILP